MASHEPTWPIFLKRNRLDVEQLESMNSSSAQAERLIQANEALAEQNRTLVEHT
jgi:hypothetical protein